MAASTSGTGRAAAGEDSGVAQAGGSTPTLAWVAGATGYVGRAVVTELGKRGIPTIAHVRPDSPELARLHREFSDLGAEVDSSRWMPEAMCEAFERQRPTMIFALLGTTRKRAQGEGMVPRHAYARVDYGLTQWLIDAAVAMDTSPRFTYLSAAGVRPNTTNPYLAARARVEAALESSELPYTIVRPSFITGPDRPQWRPGERGAAIVADALLTLAGALGAATLRDRYRSIDAAHLAKALVSITLDPAYVRRVVHGEELW